LAEGGKLVIPVGERFGQILKIAEKHGKKIEVEDSIGCVFVPLVGEYGWND
jgi:protein-L-isoaspartate(D-aspartate) O-methyltransferase